MINESADQYQGLKIQIAVAAVNQTPMAWEQNTKNILQAIEMAKAEKYQLLLLPELAITGYGCEDRFASPGLLKRAKNKLREIVAASGEIAVAVGLPLSFQGDIYNVVAFAVNGKLKGFIAKKDLAGDGVHYEGRWFKKWTRGVVAEIEFDGELVPIGDLIFDVNGVVISFEICEEAWVAQRPGGESSAYGVDIVLNPSASHFAHGKAAVRREFVTDGSRRMFAAYAYANLMGNEAGRIIYDNHLLIAQGGELVAESKRFSYKSVQLIGALVDINALRVARARSSSRTPAQEPTNRMVRITDFEFQNSPMLQLPPKYRRDRWEDLSTKQVKKNEGIRAVALGAFDFLRKSKIKGYALSKSGGADSSLTAVVVQKMVELGVAELGIEGFKQKFDYWAELQSCKSEEELMSLMLRLVYQPFENNSTKATETSARELAKDIGASYSSFPIAMIFNLIFGLLVTLFGRHLSWDNKEDDVPLQNLQARIRGVIIWLVANVERRLLLTTGNRSEIAVGYCTMDGDTNGGLNFIGGWDKLFILALLRFLEKPGKKSGLRPVPGLSFVNALQPSAELRPASAGQTDENDLMPFAVLTKIENLAIRDLKEPVEVFQALYTDSNLQVLEFSPADLHKWVRKFFWLWSVNQWKRERYAICFHVDDHNLDPKTWCRFPVLNGTFEAELKELDEFCKAF